jgi:hypothetical protein
MAVQWFPGHMHLTRKAIGERIKDIDVVVEMLDARLPGSSANPLLAELTGHKPTLKVLNKQDLADPARTTLLFERFISAERNEPPDIDIDFEHQRREEVIQYIYRKYGRHRAALTGVVISYRPRSALRDVGRALGIDLDRIDAVAKSAHWWDGKKIDPERLQENGFHPPSPLSLIHI